MNKIKEQFAPIRINQIEARWLQSGAEIVWWYQNHYFGKLDEYLREGWELKGETLWRNNSGVAKSLFESKESCLVIAFLEINEREPDVELRSVGSRILDLDGRDLSDFWTVYRKANKQLEELIQDEN